MTKRKAPNSFVKVAIDECKAECLADPTEDEWVAMGFNRGDYRPIILQQWLVLRRKRMGVS